MTPPRWVNDPGIAWRILLTADLEDPPPCQVLRDRLIGVYESQGWGSAPALLVADDLAALWRRATVDHTAPVVVGVAGRSLVVSAHHSRADGLALLHLLGTLLGTRVASPAVGVAGRRSTGGAARTAAARLLEAVLHPQARLTPRRSRSSGLPDVLVQAEVPGQWRTADVVHAAAQGAAAYLTARGRPARRVSVAVGAGCPDGSERIADRAALLRLRDVEQLDRAEVAAALRTSPVQTPPILSLQLPVGRLVDRLVAVALRLLRPALGATLLVSHLGGVEAPGVDRLVFHPVMAGGSGVAVGSISLAGADRTVVSLRARAADWDEDGLERLLEAILARF